MSPSISRGFARVVRQKRERLEFARLAPHECEPDCLIRDVTEADIGTMLASDEIDEEWRALEREMASMAITDKADSVNPGDRRAIYYLVRHFGPRSVLEVGTHLGGSTLHIAAALRSSHEGDPDPERAYHVTTVDITDVNDPATATWLQYGSKHSPAESARRLGLENQISFVTSPALDYFASHDERYDFIFLDGDHAARAVYQEVPAALRALRSNGVILLHDYFPGLQPLWVDRNVIPGPWLAVERLRSEGAKLKAIPFGQLPWDTKLGSQMTSLALLVAE